MNESMTPSMYIKPDYSADIEAWLAQLKTDLGDRLWPRFQDGGLTVVECNWADARAGEG